ncbi:DsrE family protein [Spiractinospora alimapuensis]|uniref:DsrE family protein n=1 Tax=Spiractinospora alimapuensis TaxID=2820884 RepID=UPI001F3A58A9|nr:DsrE family protein [Spiractinospora alimapuensis]QVQ50786.1 DsrE family protein [Spiractinospora alimapuensis]
MLHRLVIEVTAGAESPERVNQAFTVAASAAASGVEVSLWLTGDAAWFAVPGRAETFDLTYAPPLADLIGGILAAGSITVGTQCAARRGLSENDLIPDIVVRGVPSFVEEITRDGTQALVY